MTLLTIQDNNSYSEEKFSKIGALANEISNTTIRHLADKGVFIYPLHGESETTKASDVLNDLSSDSFILKHINNKYISTNVMGFIGLNDEQLIITSRFNQAQTNEPQNDYFLRYILGEVLEYPSLVNLNSKLNFEELIFNYLIFLFSPLLKQALRKGAFKEYSSFDYNDYNIKGVIDLPTHIVKNTPFLGKIASKRREFSYDNPVMELIRHTIEFIKASKYGTSILSNIKEEIKFITELTPAYSAYDRPKIIVKNQKQIVKHYYFKEYTFLQNLCLMILQKHGNDIGFGSNQIYGILFDGSWLWEEYINKQITPYFYHPMNKQRIGGQQLFSNTQKQQGLIYPDFIGNNPSNRLIADAKYKPSDNINRIDYFQLLAYMYRFGATTGLFIYPEVSSIEQENNVYKLNQGIAYFENREVYARNNIKIIKLGLIIPPAESDSFNSYYKRMKRAEEKFIKELKSFCNLE